MEKSLPEERIEYAVQQDPAPSDYDQLMGLVHQFYSGKMSVNEYSERSRQLLPNHSAAMLSIAEAMNEVRQETPLVSIEPPTNS